VKNFEETSIYHRWENIEIVIRGKSEKR